MHNVNKYTYKYIYTHFFCTHITNAYVHRFRFCHAQHMHTHKQHKKHTLTCTHAREFLSPVLTSVLKVRFMGQLSPMLSSALRSILLVFRKIIKLALLAFKFHVNLHLKSPLRRPSKSHPSTRLKLYFVGFPKRCKSLLHEFSNPALPHVSSSTSLVFHNVAKAHFTGFQIPSYRAS